MGSSRVKFRTQKYGLQARLRPKILHAHLHMEML